MDHVEEKLVVTGLLETLVLVQIASALFSICAKWLVAMKSAPG
ncbi:MAG TPA: hypothetical protein VGI03_02975 [Verrucomicrobiae bacterium]